MQKKNQALQGNQNSASNNTSNTNSSKATKAKNPNSKNGFFLGLEGNLGGINLNEFYHDYDSTSGSSTEKTNSFKNTTFDLGLLGGYQHYFGQSQRHGIKVSAHLYSGFGNGWDWDTTDSNWKHEYSLSYIPIKFGIDIKYLWDFLERGKHTLGLNVGLGYGFDLYMNGKKSDKAIHSGQQPDTTSTNYNTIFSNGVYPVLGLHYYYGHHQFELLYRFGGMIGFTAKQKTNIDSETYSEITTTSQSYLTFNYAYRF